jgi:cbb3-type cytochrome oxidase maturation protein
MSVVIILILASLTVGLVFVGAFVWSVRSGQYEDTLTPAMRMLADEPNQKISETKKHRTKNEHRNLQI